ncbi:MAG TPA: ABC transporter ATP-binding protein [Mycobacteriales bacterium]|nr:ABC transporter ATP-binding protein [Mycobacteriales bacterium]
MASAVTFHDVSKRFGRFTALDRVGLTVEENTICGLLGRNGAGKTTAMQILTGQITASSGQVHVFGADPYENEELLTRVCFVTESQRYPDGYRVRHVLRAASWLYPNWDGDYVGSLLEDFGLPLNCPVKKLSRGMRSWLGVVVGLAARAPLTVFDEPYLGLDAVARQLFYDRLLADYVAHPRTVLLSTHLIDEVSDLVEQVVLLDSGQVLIDEAADTLRRRAVTVTGSAAAVEEFTRGHVRLHSEQVGSLARVTVEALGEAEHAGARALGLNLESVSLQQLMVRTTARRATPASAVGADATTKETR